MDDAGREGNSFVGGPAIIVIISWESYLVRVLTSLVEEGGIMDYFRLSTKRNSGSGTELRTVCVSVLGLVVALWCFGARADITYANFPDAGGGTIAGMTLNGNLGVPPLVDPLPRPEIIDCG